MTIKKLEHNELEYHSKMSANGIIHDILHEQENIRVFGRNDWTEEEKEIISEYYKHYDRDKLHKLIFDYLVDRNETNK